MAVYISAGVVAAVSVMVLIPLILYTQRKMRDRQSTGMNTFILFSLSVSVAACILFLLLLSQYTSHVGHVCFFNNASAPYHFK